MLGFAPHLMEISQVYEGCSLRGERLIPLNSRSPNNCDLKLKI